LPPAPEEEVAVDVTWTDANGVEKKKRHSDSPARLQRAVLKDPHGGLFVWLGLLAEAAELASEKRRPITWGAVIKANAMFAAMELEPGTEEEK
jgi:hypothetical protein